MSIALSVAATSAWAVTEVNTLTPGEITQQQIAAFSGQHPYVWTPSTSFRSPGSDEAEPLPGGRDGSAAAGFLTAEQQNAGFSWDPVLGLVVLKGLLGIEGHVLATDAPGNILAGFREGEAGRRAFIWNSVTGMQDLNDVAEVPAGVTLTEVQDISASGALIGHALSAEGASQIFYWVPGAPVQILALVNDETPENVQAVSQAGHLIGQASGDQGYIWSREATRLLTSPDGAATEALGVNVAGDVVGAGSGAQEGDAPRALLWPADGSDAIDLNSRLSAPLELGVQLIRAEAINEGGEIAAYGLTSSGAVHLFMLRPDPTGPEGEQSYSPQDLGEIYLEADKQPLSGLGLSDEGDIFGACAPLAQACPAIRTLSAQELARLYDVTNRVDGVTNFFAPGGLGGPQALTSSLAPLGGLGGGAVGGGAAGGGAAGGGTPTGGGTTSPTPSSPFFPSVGVTTPTAEGGTPVAPVPVPAAIWALLMGLALLLPAGLRRRA
ncbi:hypothetical protein [Roseobacter sp. SK209-2-6]|uniref:hypothetical protein n=1 Tax=Roseobacter sp. SK209-2-6 TaxID=388739 RepID=UPI0018DD44A1|nr:hypothetical protein [Roseobacter sp. SK209-2-6]